jgi:hypothetical protein
MFVVPCLYNHSRTDTSSVPFHTANSQQPQACRASLASRALYNTFRAMDAQQYLPQTPPNLKFRVLIIGRANAGKTSILQRVVDTTESPEIYRLDRQGTRELVRPRS